MAGHQGRTLFVKNRVDGDASDAESPGSLYPVADFCGPELVGVSLVDQLTFLFARERGMLFSKDAHCRCEGFECGKERVEEIFSISQELEGYKRMKDEVDREYLCAAMNDSKRQE